ncbi:hypothetical protein [Pseudomonas sp. BN102]|uniref:hypothetical protein n=1 Tax=Pseudomonas sp. BN102 TaxID=2567886 RepID=UPI002455C503|nr:hypothetical protein [Pseudomonas sp. BN102]MDH4609941.1 hypothetical protein [Pseudomonas sp. BN102]
MPLEGLADSKIIASGEIEPISCPINGNQDCLNRQDDHYKMSAKGICFSADASCDYSCEGFIAERNVDRSLYLVDVTFEPRIVKSKIEMLQCPSES